MARPYPVVTWHIPHCPLTCTVEVLESVCCCLLHVLGFYYPAVKLSSWWKMRSIFDDGSKGSKRSLYLLVTPWLVGWLLYIASSLLFLFCTPPLYHTYPLASTHSVSPLVPDAAHVDARAPTPVACRSIQPNVCTISIPQLWVVMNSEAGQRAGSWWHQSFCCHEMMRDRWSYLQG